MVFQPAVSITSVACVLMKSMACALSWSALCMSARMRTSAAVSTDRFEQSASSHITFNRSRAYLSAAARRSSAILSRLGARPV
uniref:Putative secreted protein n=1 Tax=Ixodes ricinus TaxID=34613 RepID=A0A6B0UE59_IXORI